MGHSLQALGTASLDTMGGLVTIANPQDLPEAASPRCWDVDFIVGSVFTRAGLQSVYSFSGEFVGPRLGGASSSVGAGTPWLNPNGVLGNTTYSNVATGSTANSNLIPTLGSNEAGANPWTSPSNINVTGAPVATVSLVTGINPVFSAQLLGSGLSFGIPATATVIGVATFLRAAASGVPAGTTSVNVQLAHLGVPIGTKVNVPINTVMSTYVQGSSGYQWGTTLTPAIVNGSGFGILVQAQVAPTAGTASFEANTLSVTAYYTTASSAQELQVKTFSFSLPPTAGPTGFVVNFNAFSSAATVLTLQMLKNGLPVGSTHQQVLNAAHNTYTLGAANDLWGTSWLFSDVNSASFGIEVTASGLGTSNIKNLTLEAFFTPSLANVNYVKSYEQNNDRLFTFVLDASGILYKEDVLNTPNTLTVALTGILPGSYAQSATEDDQEYIMFSDLSIGTERPRVASEKADGSGLQFLPLSQVGPGAPPSFTASLGASGTALALTNFSVTANVVSFTYTAGPVVLAGNLYTLSGVSAALNGTTVSVLAGGLTATTFTATTAAPDDAGGAITGVATPQGSFKIASITQPTAVGGWQDLTWGSGPGPSLTAGTLITVYYDEATLPPDPNLIIGGWVQIVGSPYVNGVFQITGLGSAFPSDSAGSARNYLVYDTGQTNRQHYGGGSVPGTYQVTLATLVMQTQMPGVSVGTSIAITGATPTNWNKNWTITAALNSALMTITSTQMINGNLKYGFSLVSGVAPVTADKALVTITQTLNGNGIFNLTGTIDTVTGAFFFINGIGSIGQNIPSVGESGQAQTFGTKFQFDPGPTNSGTAGVAIFAADTNTGVVSLTGAASNAISPGTRQAVVFFITDSGYETAPSPPIIFNTTSSTNAISAAQIPVGPPNVKARGIAITEAGANGVPGANFYVIRNPVTVSVQGQTPVTYTSTIIHDNITTHAVFTFTDAVLLASDEIDVQGHDLFNLIELGSSAWALPYASRMFYGLQLNKVDNFLNMTFDGGYLLNPTSGANLQPLGWTPNPAANPGGGAVYNITAFSITGNVVTIVAANSLTAGQQVLFAGLGVATYLNGLVLTVLPTGLSAAHFQVSFTNANVALTPDTGTATEVNEGTTLIVSTVTGMSLYVHNTLAATQPAMGFYYQSAYQDAYNVAIIHPNTTYSVRVAASNPSGIKTGTFVVELVNFNKNTGFGVPFGSFSIPFTSMTSNVAVFTGTLLTTPFDGVGGVPVDLQLAFFVSNMGFGADVQIDRMEVFPTEQPFLFTQVYGSYIDNLESIDASGTGGIIDTTPENDQHCMGGFVMHDLMYLMKTASMYSTEDDPTSEPGGWGLHEVSNRVGTVGIHAFDAGEEWSVMACRNGIYGFNGGQPVKIMQEIWQIWEAINWDHGNNIVLRVDIINKKMYCAIPLPTGVNPDTNVATASIRWLPNAPYNPAPTVPNVMLMLNYQGLGTFEELVSSAEMHTTMFGTLAAVDMKRKWTIWQIPSPYMGFITRPDNSQPLFICNGIASSKVYQLEETQRSDDGVAINSLYTTYGFVNAAKAATLPIFGFHAKRYTTLQVTTSGSGAEQVRILPNTIGAVNNAGVFVPVRYPYTVPGVVQVSGLVESIKLVDPAFDDWFRPLNVKGNRAFLEFSTNAVGDYFLLSKILLSGKADPWSSINPTGGGNAGIA